MNGILGSLEPVDEAYGFYLVAFLRKIGAANASHIERIELTLGSLSNAADILPLFAEILKQHMKGLQRLAIARSLDASILKRDNLYSGKLTLGRL